MKAWELLGGSGGEDEGKAPFAAESGDLFIASGLDKEVPSDYKPGSGSSIRFWLPPGTQKKIIFLTEAAQAKIFYEHQFMLGGSWFNFFTCLKTNDPESTCPMCDFAMANGGKFARYGAAAMTIIDTHQWTDKLGNTRQNEKKLLVIKQNSIEIIRRKANSLKSQGKHLRGAAFDVFRKKTKKSSSIGDDYEYAGHVDLTKLGDAADLDYAKILARRPKDMQQVVTALLRAGSFDGGSFSSRDDDDTEMFGGDREEGTTDTVSF